jgi:hypothetical protein
MSGQAKCSVDGGGFEDGSLNYAGLYDGNPFLTCAGPHLNGTATIQLPGRAARTFSLLVVSVGVYANLLVPDWTGRAGTGQGVIAVPPACHDPTPVTLTSQLRLLP